MLGPLSVLCASIFRKNTFYTQENKDFRAFYAQTAKKLVDLAVYRNNTIQGIVGWGVYKHRNTQSYKNRETPQ